MLDLQFAVYVHWPFCASKCPYCDFNSHVRAAVDYARWEKAYLADIHHAALATKGAIVTSVFFGGGTPSLMPPSLVSRIIETIREAWPMSSHAEITLEANPNSVEIEKLESFAAAGVNRLSLGIQSLREEALKFLGRKHSVDEATKAIQAAQKTFKRFSFDLIYTRPNQSLEAWEEELEEALTTFAPSHLSLYQLTIEPQTPFEQLYLAGKLHLPSDEKSAAFYTRTEDIMRAYGLPPYEISNYAREGEECCHNLTYWTYQNYVGIGPGAHGRFEEEGIKYAVSSHRAPEEWLRRVEEKGTGVNRRLALTFEERLQECLLMNLRLTKGLEKARLEDEMNAPFTTLLPQEKIDILKKENLLLEEGGFLIPTFEGKLKLNAMLRFLYASSFKVRHGVSL